MEIAEAMTLGETGTFPKSLFNEQVRNQAIEQILN